MTFSKWKQVKSECQLTARTKKKPPVVQQSPELKMQRLQSALVCALLTHTPHGGYTPHTLRIDGIEVGTKRLTTRIPTKWKQA